MRIAEVVAAARDQGTPEARTRAVTEIAPSEVEALLHGSVDAGANPLFAVGTGVSPGGASGPVYFTSTDVLDAHDRGEAPVLCCVETTPADEPALRVAAAVVTARGGAASHAAVVARALGIPAVCGVDGLHFGERMVTSGGLAVAQGETVTVDATAGTVSLGAGAAGAPTEPPPELDELLRWADELRGGVLGVRANADNGEDAARARAFGAEGVGLCRTEHMFLGDRVSVLQRVILAEDGAAEADALDELRSVQREELVSVLAAMDGLPVAVRLLDPPLHEFLPSQAAGSAWHERNPMTGTRGVRLAVLREGLYPAQVRAVAEAVRHRIGEHGDPRVELLIPLVTDPEELRHVRALVDQELDRADLGEHRPRVGTMIETPRAALLASALAEHADFFSVGTNDLTQLVFGFSRDDVEARVLPAYLRHGLLRTNPFEHLDEDAVVPLVARAVAGGRASRPGLPVGVCGEHGGDPRSIRLLAAAGVDHVSCSPYRVPIARLAAAQAVVAGI